MKRGPRSGAAAPVDFLAKVREAWGETPPDEVTALARAAQAQTASAAATAIGYSPAVVSQVLGKRYPGDLGTVFAKIRGALMGETVVCPVLGEIGRDRCVREQKRPFAATNATRAKLFHACKTCPNRQTPSGSSRPADQAAGGAA